MAKLRAALLIGLRGNKGGAYRLFDPGGAVLFGMDYDAQLPATAKVAESQSDGPANLPERGESNTDFTTAWTQLAPEAPVRLQVGRNIGVLLVIPKGKSVDPQLLEQDLVGFGKIKITRGGKPVLIGAIEEDGSHVVKFRCLIQELTETGATSLVDNVGKGNGKYRFSARDEGSNQVQAQAVVGRVTSETEQQTTGGGFSVGALTESGVDHCMCVLKNMRSNAKILERVASEEPLKYIPEGVMLGDLKKLHINMSVHYMALEIRKDQTHEGLFKIEVKYAQNEMAMAARVAVEEVQLEDGDTVKQKLEDPSHNEGVRTQIGMISTSPKVDPKDVYVNRGWHNILYNDRGNITKVPAGLYRATDEGNNNAPLEHLLGQELERCFSNSADGWEALLEKPLDMNLIQGRDEQDIPASVIHFKKHVDASKFVKFMTPKAWEEYRFDILTSERYIGKGAFFGMPRKMKVQERRRHDQGNGRGAEDDRHGKMAWSDGAGMAGSARAVARSDMIDVETLRQDMGRQIEVAVSRAVDQKVGNVGQDVRKMWDYCNVLHTETIPKILKEQKETQDNVDILSEGQVTINNRIVEIMTQTTQNIKTIKEQQVNLDAMMADMKALASGADMGQASCAAAAAASKRQRHGEDAGGATDGGARDDREINDG